MVEEVVIENEKPSEVTEEEASFKAKQQYKYVIGRIKSTHGTPLLKLLKLQSSDVFKEMDSEDAAAAGSHERLLQLTRERV